MKVKNIALELIKYPKVQLRSPEDMTGIDELAMSIETNGLLNPLTVRAKGEEYELLAGGRRFEAVKRMGWTSVPCNVITPPKDIERTITLVENQSRESVNPLEEAQYYEYLQKELGYTQEQIGNFSGTTAAHVNQMLKLLTLDEYTMGALAVGDISASQARELSRCPDEGYRRYLVDIIKKNGASVLVLQRWVNERIGFISQQERIAAPPPYTEPPRETAALGGICDGCGSEMESGGLQTIMLCPNCYRAVKEAISGAGEGEGRGES